MPLKLYNTLGRKKQVFKPIKKGEVGMYSCGPTVYNYAHIGNFRAYMCSDILKRYLKYKGYNVKHVMNITDVDDKTIRDSSRQGISLKKFTETYTRAFFEDTKQLNIGDADYYPKATECIGEMIALIKILINKGIAYKGEDGSVYYSVSKFDGYGKLSKIKLKKLKSGARVKQDEYEKEQVNDFALWKAYAKEDGDVFWETDIGKGRPGWHIECSAMSMKYLGESFDIHTGGVDLIFPHHENEIAQSEGANEKPFVKYWFHNEYIMVDGKKMSKSLGNFFTLRDLLAKGYDPRAIRFVLLSSHYRQQLNFTLGSIDSAKKTIERIDDFILKLNSIKNEKENDGVDKLIGKAKTEFEKSMDDDLNISQALASIFDFMKEINKLIQENELGEHNAKEIIKTMCGFDSVFGVLKKEKSKIPDEIEKLVGEREKARKNKDWKKADELRAEIKEKGYVIEDTKEGHVVKKI